MWNKEGFFVSRDEKQVAIITEPTLEEEEKKERESGDLVVHSQTHDAINLIYSQILHKWERQSVYLSLSVSVARIPNVHFLN